MPKRKSDPADTLDSCVRVAIEQVKCAVTAFDGGCDKESVANLAKLVGIIGELRTMIGLDVGNETRTGVVILPPVRTGSHVGQGSDELLS
ncbi:MAG: hypothetical protein IJC50_05440 [Clostridia bacterium]|nr:hypothetical protein [Clostridia bacterium]